MENHVKIIKDFGTISNFIAGKETASTSQKSEPIYSPYTGEVVGHVPTGTAQDVDLAVNAAKNAFLSWKKTHIKQRVQVMFTLKNLLEQNIDSLANLVSLENGKTLTESKAGILKAIEVIEFGCSIPNKISGDFQEVSDGVECRFSREPLGVVASITPFNFPAMVPFWTIPIALTVGNTMILKPSEQVPLTALRLAHLLKEAGLPDGVLNVVHGKADVVEAICDHPNIAAVSFVGSTKIAKAVYTRGTATGKRVLALGGAKNHLYLLPDADMDYTPNQIVDSAIGCAGQRCMAASVLIAIGNCDAYIKKMIEYARSIKIGTGLGAIINKQSVERINHYITQAEQLGAKILVDGRNVKPKDYIENSQNGYWVGPTIIDHVTPDMPCAKEEIFGPVLSIIHAENLEQALQIGNRSEYGNAASIYTTNGGAAKYLADNASAGMIGINIGVPVPREPFGFGGWNQSKFGVGDITGDAGISFWTKDKKVTTKWVNPTNRNWMS